MLHALPGLRPIARLVDGSHFVVRVLACPVCGQHCVSIFTETIDWQDGEDPQYRSVLPVTSEESAALLAASPDSLVALIESLGRDRRYLQDDWPKDAPHRTRWADGPLLIGPHD